VAHIWRFSVREDGPDLVAYGWATWWDDAVTSSGVPAATPGMVACSLPTGRNMCGATAGSPFPPLPWFTVVKVYWGESKRVVYCPLIDEGPAWTARAGTGVPGSAMIDLTPAAHLLLGNVGSDRNIQVNVQVMRDLVFRREMLADLAAMHRRLLLGL